MLDWDGTPIQALFLSSFVSSSFAYLDTMLCWGGATSWSQRQSLIRIPVSVILDWDTTPVQALFCSSFVSSSLEYLDTMLCWGGAIPWSQRQSLIGVPVSSYSILFKFCLFIFRVSRYDVVLRRCRTLVTSTVINQDPCECNDNLVWNPGPGSVPFKFL